MRKEITAPQVPLGRHYSHAVRSGNMVYTTGQVPVDANGKTVGDDIVTQAGQVFENLASILDAAGAGFDDVVKTTMYVTNIEDVALLSDLRSEVFGDTKPASVGIQVPRLWDPQHLIEIEVIAQVND
ncbi:RidA family protein [Arthrobacter mobilis]|uniref:RidA family protein n=1 Tax=Arthrobacter mobilis TaxID=2724944 RepID=A0A7X6QMI6_9MICC|nr:RidA family protein [Arthrobacter mobilis]NKX56673.1 RidA family protein [Arthrobacter mobilis]